MYCGDRAGVRAMVMLLPLLGTTWLLSLLVPLSPVFSYLFILCNSLQVPPLTPH